MFDYDQAFSRNIGWLTQREQSALRNARVAIAGMGGVGGAHLLTLARLGVGKFNIADFDEFDVVNFNRQRGATVQSLGRKKSEVLAEMARDINPELDLRVFSEPVSAANVGAFLDEADVYVDGLDFFALEARETVFGACRARGIPAVTAAPLGMGTALLTFLPGRMSFDDYFGLFRQKDETLKAIHFLVGLAPKMIHRGYLAEPSVVDFVTHRVPSTVMGCELCAGVAATETLKILLKRGPSRCAPHGYQFDAFTRRQVSTWVPGGYRNPLQRAKIALACRLLKIDAARR